MTPPLILAPHTAIDLQLHHTHSDGTWTPSQLVDTRCYGFDPAKNALQPFAQDIARCQSANTREVYEHLNRKGILFPDPLELGAFLEKPSA